MEKRPDGHPVYYVTPNRHLTMPDGEEKTIKTDSFYALIGIPRYFKKRDLLDHLRKDSQVVFHLCLVGGGSNGIPTGEKVVSMGKLNSWELHQREA